MTQILRSIERMGVPAPHLFRSLFLEGRQRIFDKRSVLLRERERIREQGMNAATRLLLHEMPASPKMQGTPLELIRKGGQ